MGIVDRHEQRLCLRLREHELAQRGEHRKRRLAWMARHRRRRGVEQRGRRGGDPGQRLAGGRPPRDDRAQQRAGDSVGMAVLKHASADAPHVQPRSGRALTAGGEELGLADPGLPLDEDDAPATLDRTCDRAVDESQLPLTLQEASCALEPHADNLAPVGPRMSR